MTKAMRTHTSNRQLYDQLYQEALQASKYWSVPMLNQKIEYLDTLPSSTWKVATLCAYLENKARLSRY